MEPHNAEYAKEIGVENQRELDEKWKKYNEENGIDIEEERANSILKVISWVSEVKNKPDDPEIAKRLVSVRATMWCYNISLREVGLTGQEFEEILKNCKIIIKGSS